MPVLRERDSLVKRSGDLTPAIEVFARSQVLLESLLGSYTSKKTLSALILDTATFKPGKSQMDIYCTTSHLLLSPSPPLESASCSRMRSYSGTR